MNIHCLKFYVIAPLALKDLSVFGQSRRARESMVYCFCIRINVEDTVCFLMELFHRESNRRKRDMDGSLSYGVKSLGRQIFDSN